MLYAGELVVFEVVGLHLGEAAHNLHEFFDWEYLALLGESVEDDLTDSILFIGGIGTKGETENDE